MQYRFLIAFASAALLAQGPETPDWQWRPTARLAEARYDSCAVTLANSSVLISGGIGLDGNLKSAEIYHPEGALIAAALMNHARSGHSCTLLADERVPVAGGDSENAGTAELNDPRSNEWTLAANTGVPRRGHTATPLPDMRVLLAGGVTPGGPTQLIELFDPFTNTLITPPISLATPRQEHRAVPLDEGRVLIVGGSNETGAMRSSEIYMPSSGEITAGPDLGLPRSGHSATLLLDGRVLIAGGSDGTINWAMPSFMYPTTISSPGWPARC